MILSNFWTDRDERVQSIEVASWLNALRGIPSKQINAAWDRYQANGPRSENGKLLKPMAHDIRERVMAARKSDSIRTHAPKAFLSKPEPEPERIPVSAEAAQRIMDDAGYTPDLSRALKRFPRAQTRQRVEELVEEPPEKVMTYETDPERLAEARRKAGVL